MRLRSGHNGPTIDRYKNLNDKKLCFLCFRGGPAMKGCKMKDCGIDGKSQSQACSKQDLQKQSGSHYCNTVRNQMIFLNKQAGTGPGRRHI